MPKKLDSGENEKGLFHQTVNFKRTAADVRCPASLRV